MNQLKIYRQFLNQLRACLGPSQLTFTALGAWLKDAGFLDLAKAFPNYVLQLHYLDRISNGDFALYNSKQAEKFVQTAENFGVPFRIALPTYSYYLTLDDTGAIAKIEAEGYESAVYGWFDRKWIHADFAAIAADLARFRKEAQQLKGVIWFRLPLNSDENALSLAGLDRLRRGGSIKDGNFTLTARPTKPGLYDLQVTNDGDLAAAFPQKINLRAPGGRFLTWDILPPCTKETFTRETLVIFCNTTQTNKNRVMVKPGRPLTLGWFRVQNAREVIVETTK